jgi:hypothetical protein
LNIALTSPIFAHAPVEDAAMASPITSDPALIEGRRPRIVPP